MEEDSDQSLLSRFKSLFRKAKPRDEGAELTEEIYDLMDEGQAKGLISGEVSEMVHAVIDLKETKAYEIMVPRTQVVSAPLTISLADAIKLISDCGHTRIPIYKDSVDEISGILHAKDLLKMCSNDPASRIPPEVLRRPHFVSFNQKASDVLRELQERKAHLAIVTDEYGGMAGIITVEDVIEEIVGEIMDEHDKERPLMNVLDENTVSVDARLEVEKLAEHFDMPVPEGEFESVGGLVIHLLGKIPKVNDKVSFENLEMTVQTGDSRRIGKILVSRKTSSLPSPAEADQP
ncbi:MAG: HlyC/CorC family transporter [Deltaproteobacteria bacterium]|nr:HlyC/CorC family transporter [Deltaproteobacteria bacterium]